MGYVVEWWKGSEIESRTISWEAFLRGLVWINWTLKHTRDKGRDVEEEVNKRYCKGWIWMKHCLFIVSWPFCRITLEIQKRTVFFFFLNWFSVCILLSIITLEKNRLSFTGFLFVFCGHQIRLQKIQCIPENYLCSEHLIRKFSRRVLSVAVWIYRYFLSERDGTKRDSTDMIWLVLFLNALVLHHSRQSLRGASRKWRELGL